MPTRLNELNTFSINALILNALYVPFLYVVTKYGEQIVILTLFMFIDFIFGIAKSIKLKIRVTANKMMRGILGKLLSWLMPLLLYFFSRGIGNFDEQLEIMLPYIFSLFIAVEMYSILGNFYAFRTGKVLDDIDLISFIYLKLREKIVSAIKGFLK